MKKAGSTVGMGPPPPPPAHKPRPGEPQNPKGNRLGGTPHFDFPEGMAFLHPIVKMPKGLMSCLILG